MTVEQIKQMIVTARGSLPEPRYDWERYELEREPKSYYKAILLNLVYDEPDEGTLVSKCCSSDCCSEWKTGLVPKGCRQCWNFDKKRYTELLPLVMEKVEGIKDYEPLNCV